jgi:hypothetical protein
MANSREQRRAGIVAVPCHDLWINQAGRPFEDADECSTQP